MELPFRIVNVFGIDGNPFSGNALGVFEATSGVDDAEMQAWARQFNLSEVTFVVDDSATPTGGPAHASVRIFTATYEMPFAGHPTLGTAHVVADTATARSGAHALPTPRIPNPARAGARGGPGAAGPRRPARRASSKPCGRRASYRSSTSRPTSSFPR